MTIAEFIALLQDEIKYRKLLAKGLTDQKLKEEVKAFVKGLERALQIVQEGKRE